MSPGKAGRNSEWKARYDGGESVKSIADSAGVTRQRVYQVLNESGSSVLERKRKRRDRRETIIDLRLLGVPLRQIAADTGYSLRHVNAVLSEYRKANG